MKVSLIKFLICIALGAWLSGCYEFNPSLDGGIGVRVNIPIRMHSSIASEHFPALEETEARDFMIDCIADKKEKNIISSNCHKAFDFYREPCFASPTLKNNSCKALFNIASMTNNTLILKKLNNKSNGIFPEQPIYDKLSGDVYFIDIK